MGKKGLLFSKMAQYGDRQEDLAEALGLSLSRLNAKIKRRKDAEFRQNEIMKIIHRYALTPEEVIEIFFTFNEK